MAVLIDANVIISFLIRSEKTEEAKRLLERVEGPVISMNIIEEIVYVGLSLIYGVRGFKLREKIAEGVCEEAERFLNTLASFLDEYDIKIVSIPKNFDEMLRIVKEYRLLPNDALIVATCKHHGISKIATFDEDFKRVDFLDVLEIEEG